MEESKYYIAMIATTLIVLMLVYWIYTEFEDYEKNPTPQKKYVKALIVIGVSVIITFPLYTKVVKPYIFKMGTDSK
jgi:multisubunit Na+/H+ antiporter MnhB subunit